MKIAISGSEDFVGAYVAKFFKDFASDIFLLNEYEDQAKWKDIISNSDVIINLSGSQIIGRWTKERKKIIHDSRINATKRIVSILNDLQESSKKITFISASTTGIYPEDKIHPFTTLFSPKEVGFLAEITAKWEAEVEDVVNPSVRIIIARLGVILSKEGGMIKNILPAFKKGFGYSVGSGNQIISFVHIKDVAEALKFFIKNTEISGFFNIVAPHPATNNELTKTLARQLKRPRLIRIPAFLLKAILGESACVLLNGIEIYPDDLLAKKFSFEYPTIDKAIAEILNS